MAGRAWMRSTQRGNAKGGSIRSYVSWFTVKLSVNQESQRMHTVHTRRAHTFPVAPPTPESARARGMCPCVPCTHQLHAWPRPTLFDRLVTFNSLLFYHTHHD